MKTFKVRMSYRHCWDVRFMYNSSVVQRQSACVVLSFRFNKPPATTKESAVATQNGCNEQQLGNHTKETSTSQLCGKQHRLPKSCSFLESCECVWFSVCMCVFLFFSTSVTTKLQDVNKKKTQSSRTGKKGNLRSRTPPLVKSLCKGTKQLGAFPQLFGGWNPNKLTLPTVSSSKEGQLL